MKMTRLLLILLLSGLTACSSVPENIKSPARIQAELSHRNALLAMRDGRIETAEYEWRTALQGYQAIDDWQGQGMARLGLAQIQARLGDKQSAEQVLAPLLDLAVFSPAQKSQAAVQMAQLVQLQDSARAAAYLRLARQSCALPCRLEVQILNLNAQLALRALDLESANHLALQAINLADGNKVELAYSQRILAEVALQQQQYATALSWLELAIVLDRQSAEPAWLLENYRLMQKIARQSGDELLLARSEVHLSSLCAALDCSP